jgi:hypothetical protein
MTTSGDAPPISGLKTLRVVKVAHPLEALQRRLFATESTLEFTARFAHSLVTVDPTGMEKPETPVNNNSSGVDAVSHAFPTCGFVANGMHGQLSNQPDRSLEMLRELGSDRRRPRRTRCIFFAPHRLNCSRPG